MIMIYGTSNGPQNDIGNYIGPCSNSRYGGAGKKLKLDPEKATLVERVKAFQKTDQEKGREGGKMQQGLLYWFLVGNKGI